MKFCPECGSPLQIETAKFCSSCGFNLTSLTSAQPQADQPVTVSSPLLPQESISTEQLLSQTITSTAAAEEEEQTDEEKPISIYKLGVSLEDTVEKIHQSMGYTTQRRRRLSDSTGTKHEIDVYATKGNRIRAIECKNYDESRSVGIKELRDFVMKVTSLKIRDALFVTNTTFSSELEKFALGKNINLWDGDELRERFFSMTIGRLGSGQHTSLELALPISVTFEEISRLDIANPELAKIQARLVLHPYYKVDWKIDIIRYDPARGKHRLQDQDTCVIDALDGEVINPKESLVSGLIGGLFKKSDEKLAMKEEKQIVEELIAMKPESKYKVTQTSDYAVSQLKPTVKVEMAQKTAVQQVIDDTRKEESYKVRTRHGEETKKILLMAKPIDVIIRKSSLIYVPKWNVDIESGQITFMRKVLAASKVVLVDTIAYCPRHLSLGDLQLIKKQTCAICEICGCAFCKDHIFQVENKFYCEEHNPNKSISCENHSDQQTPSTNEQIKKAEDSVKKMAGRWGSFFG